MEKYGQQINGSRFFRGFCYKCNEPVRLTEHMISLKRSIVCRECSPKHIGCSSPPSPIDYDAYGGGSVSTQTECHNFETF